MSGIVRPGKRRARLLAVLALLSAVMAVPSAGHERAGEADGSAPALALDTLARSPAAIVGLSSHYLRVGDVRRHYLLYVPPALRNRPAPLVVAFHGLHLSAAWMTTHTGLVRAAAQAGVALALPDAISGAWNDGRLGPHGPDDVRFTAALVTELCRDRVAQPTRVTVAGYSNGAELALELASRDPTAFDAVVSVSGALPAIPGAAHPHSPIAAYFVHGTADPVQPWPGRPGRNRLHPALESQDATVGAFVAADEADPVPQRVMSGAVEQLTWRPGKPGAPVVLYRLVGAGHGWPVARSSCGRILCGGHLDAATLVMRVAVQDDPRA